MRLPAKPGTRKSSAVFAISRSFPYLIRYCLRMTAASASLFSISASPSRRFRLHWFSAFVAMAPGTPGDQDAIAAFLAGTEARHSPGPPPSVHFGALALRKNRFCAPLLRCYVIARLGLPPSFSPSFSASFCRRTQSHVYLRPTFRKVDLYQGFVTSRAIGCESGYETPIIFNQSCG